MRSSSVLMAKNGFSKLLCGIALFLGLLITDQAVAAIGDRLEVSGNSATLYAGPSSTASRLVALRAGEQMVEMERQGSWVFVSVKSNGMQGWIRSSDAALASATPKLAKPKAVKKKVEKRVKKRVVKKAQRKAVKKKTPVKVVEQQSESLNSSEYTTRKISFKDLGYLKGVMFEGTAGTHGHSFFFDAPLDSRIVNGKLRLLFRAAPDLHELSTLRISINDIPFKQIPLPADGNMHEIDLLLPSSAFKGKHVKVTIRSTLLVTKDRCFDDRINGAYLHLLQESSLALSYKAVEKTIRDAWRMLPKKVSISISEGALTEKQFTSVLGLMALLVENNKEVFIKRLPEMGDIVVASKAEIERLMREKRADMATSNIMLDMATDLDHVSNLALLRLPDRAIIAVTDPYDVQPMYLLSNEWKLLAAGQSYRVYQPDSIRMKLGLMTDEGTSAYYELPLNKLGMDTAAKYLTREVTWQTVVNPFALPLGTRADFISLNIIAPVHWEKDPSYEMYVFLNDILVKSVRLENTGLKQSFTVNLPYDYQRQYNDLRVVVQHDIEQGDCRGVMPHDYIQITPDSALVVKKTDDGDPEKFSDLANYFSQGFDTYLEASYLNQPERVMHLMARLASDFPLLIDHSRVYFKGKNEVLSPEQPFVAVGNFTLAEEFQAPIRFDRGRVTILSPGGESYFDVNKLDKVTIAELAHTPSAFGLLVKPSEEADFPLMEKLELSVDDVAFIDTLGVIKTLDSKETSLAQVYYPDVEDWFDTLGKYRFWFMVLLWFLLTMIVVYLYRMSRSNLMARQADDEMYQDEEVQMHGDAAAHLHEDHTVHPDSDTLDHLDQQK